MVTGEARRRPWAVSAAAALSLWLGGCIPAGSRPDPAPAAPTPRPQAVGGADLRQCHAELNRLQIAFRPLEDRRFDGGCSALGAVQLLDIGTPVTNLGAMTCPLALRFARWVRESVQPAAVTRLGAPVRRIETFGTYACRTRNSRPGARLSEHGLANAVDISAFLLADGRRITVADGWRGEEERVRLFLRDIHQGGCRRFQVGLGPDSDSFHQDHLHFDLGRGPYCR